MADILDYVPLDGSYQEGVYNRLDRINENTSPLLFVPMSNILAETTLASPTAIDDYVVNVVSATGIVIKQILSIYSVAEDRVYFGRVLAINALAITVDTPLQFAFPSGAKVSSGSTNMNVNGSVTPKIFGVRNPSTVDIPARVIITRLVFKCLTTGNVDSSIFGDIVGGLTRGIVLRKVDGQIENIWNCKTNADLKGIMYDIDIQSASGNQQDGFTGRLTFTATGAAIEIGQNEDLQLIVQDNLTSLLTFEITAEGHFPYAL